MRSGRSPQPVADSILMSSTGGPTALFSESDLLEALRACYTSTPSFRRPLDIVELGLVESIHLEADFEAPGAGIPGVPQKHRLTLTLLATSDDEDAQSQLHAQIANRLAGLPELSHTSIVFAESPRWTPARLAPEARRLLQLNFPILNNRVR